MEETLNTPINVLITKKKNRFDKICISVTKNGLRCKNRKGANDSCTDLCYTHNKKTKPNEKSYSVIGFQNIVFDSPIIPVGSLDLVPKSDFYDDLGSLGLDCELINAWDKDENFNEPKFYNNYSKKSLCERAEFLQLLLKDTPMDPEKLKPLESSNHVFDWVKCEQCQTYSLLQAGGCKPCKLFSRIVELPK